MFYLSCILLIKVILKTEQMTNLEQTIISKIRNLNFRVGIQEPSVIKKIYSNFTDEQIRNIKHFDNIVGTCEKGWDVDQTIQNHLY